MSRLQSANGSASLFLAEASGSSILIRLLVGLAVFFPEGIQKLIFPDILGVKENSAIHGFNRWTLNSEAFSMEEMKPVYTVHKGPPLPAEIPQCERRHPPLAFAPE